MDVFSGIDETRASDLASEAIKDAERLKKRPRRV